MVAVQEGPGLAISTAAAAARRVGALLRQSTADPKQQKFDAITGDHTAPASAGQVGERKKERKEESTSKRGFGGLVVCFLLASHRPCFALAGLLLLSLSPFCSSNSRAGARGLRPTAAAAMYTSQRCTEAATA